MLRAVFGKEQIACGMAADIDQYVILGADYNTFAMRRHDLLGCPAIYELDWPSTQTEKLRRMATAHIPRPRNTRYVAADLN